MGYLPFHRFDTAPVPVQDRPAALQQQLGGVFDVAPIGRHDHSDVTRMDSWLLSGAVLATARGPAFRFERTAAALSRDGRRSYLIQLYQQGSVQLSWSHGTCRVGPGDILVSDFTTPHVSQETAFHSISLLVDASCMEELLDMPEVGARKLDRRQPLTALLANQLQTLAGQTERLTLEESGCAVDSMARLAAATLNPGLDERSLPGLRAALAARLRAYVDRHLHSSELDMETVLRHFGISRSTLYRLFENDGGFYRYVSRRRLLRALREVTHPGNSHLTLAEIGTRLGYRHASEFSRAFRRQFGFTAGEARERARRWGRRRFVADDVSRPGALGHWIAQMA